MNPRSLEDSVSVRVNPRVVIRGFAFARYRE